MEPLDIVLVNTLNCFYLLIRVKMVTANHQQRGLMDIDIYYFFTPSRFPWSLVGSTYPVYGPSYLYACRLVAQFAGQESGVLLGSPSLFELERFRDNSTIQDLYKHFRQLEENRDPYNKKDLVEEVLDYIRNHAEFRLYLKKKLIAEHMKGNHLPEASIYLTKSRDY
jgi:hypothetical protein